jgi:hypothetical protein
MLSKVEQFVFFPILRVLGLVFALGFLLILIGGLVFFTTVNNRGINGSYVSFDDVKAIVNPEESGTSTARSALRHSTVIYKYFSSDENKKILENWLAIYESDREKQNYLDNLSEIIVQAEKRDREKVYDYLNAYPNLKKSRIKTDEFSKTLNKYTAAVLNGAIIFGLVIVFMAFIITIILLLLLSIERNTRKAADSSMAA